MCYCSTGLLIVVGEAAILVELMTCHSTVFFVITKSGHMLFSLSSIRKKSLRFIFNHPYLYELVRVVGRLG